jgi:hypothetical protein
VPPRTLRLWYGSVDSNFWNLQNAFQIKKQFCRQLLTTNELMTATVDNYGTYSKSVDSNLGICEVLLSTRTTPSHIPPGPSEMIVSSTMKVLEYRGPSVWVLHVALKRRHHFRSKKTNKEHKLIFYSKNLTCTYHKVN